MAFSKARSTWLAGGLAAALVVVLGLIVSPQMRSTLEASFYDRAVAALDATPSTPVLLVTADAASIERLGQLPWSLDVHASLLGALADTGADVIAFTSPLTADNSEAERLRDAIRLLDSSEGDTREQARRLRELLASSTDSDPATLTLAQAITTHGKVVLPMPVVASEANNGVPGDARIVVSSDILHAAAQAPGIEAPAAALSRSAAVLGHTSFIPDPDGTIRRDFSFLRIGTALVPSLSTAIAMAAKDIRASDLRFKSANALQFGTATLRLDDHLSRLPHPLRVQDVREVSYVDVIEKRVDPSLLDGAIVLVNPNTTSSELNLRTALGLQSESMWIASSALALLDQLGYQRTWASQIGSFGMCLVVVLVSLLLIPRLSVTSAIIVSTVIALALLVAEFALLGSTGLWFQWVLAAVALLVGTAVNFGARGAAMALPSSSAVREDGSSLRSLGQTFQKQGQLDLAFETLRRCPLDTATMEQLYALGLDYEKRHQYPKALAVYSYMGTHDAGYRDLRVRRAQVIRQGTEYQKQLNTPRPAPVSTPVAAVDDYEVDLPPPRSSAPPKSSTRTLGRYEIERELGKGAMGVVYLGRDPKINRVVAIKAIPLAEEFEEEDLAEARARFFREAEMAGRLNHPAIVTVYDAGEDQGLAYIAMEYLRGQHLSHFADASRLLPPKSVMMLAARVAEALHYAHKQNVVHRDIKPANIMFNPESDELKITDFGIARLTDVSRTKTGIVLGTPSFMSPEQLEGRSLDGRSDLFALGVSLYQLLTGQLPFRADSMPRLMQKIATEPHTPIEQMRSDLPAGISAIIDKSLAKSQEARYQNGGEFAAALRACAQSEDIQW